MGKFALRTAMVVATFLAVIAGPGSVLAKRPPEVIFVCLGSNCLGAPPFEAISTTYVTPRPMPFTGPDGELAPEDRTTYELTIVAENLTSMMPEFIRLLNNRTPLEMTVIEERKGIEFSRLALEDARITRVERIQDTVEGDVVSITLSGGDAELSGAEFGVQDLMTTDSRDRCKEKCESRTGKENKQCLLVCLREGN